jgi:hypothetical protein
MATVGASCREDEQNEQSDLQEHRCHERNSYGPQAAPFGALGQAPDHLSVDAAVIEVFEDINAVNSGDATFSLRSLGTFVVGLHVQGAPAGIKRRSEPHICLAGNSRIFTLTSGCKGQHATFF